jgi:hypothetical protein
VEMEKPVLHHRRDRQLLARLFEFGGRGFFHRVTVACARRTQWEY